MFALINTAWRGQVAAYLAVECPSGLNQQTATTLLGKLFARKPNIVLNDDQEAMLVVLAQRSVEMA